MSTEQKLNGDHLYVLSQSEMVSQKSRKWCWTLHKFFPNQVIRLRHPDAYGCRYVIFGREFCPTTKVRHLQGFFYFKNALTLSGVKKKLGRGFNHIHLEIARGSIEDNEKYCSKDGDFESIGERPQQGKRSDLDEIKAQLDGGASLKDIAVSNFSQWCYHRRSFQEYVETMSRPELRPELEVFAIVGAAGVGKTRFIWETHSKDPGGLWISNVPDLKWFDGYGGEQTVVLDDFRGGADLAFLLRLLDIYPLRVPVKGSFTWFRPRRIYITSNLEPAEWYPDADDTAQAALLRRIKKTARISAASNPTWDSVRRFLVSLLGDGGRVQE